MYKKRKLNKVIIYKNVYKLNNVNSSQNSFGIVKFYSKSYHYLNNSHYKNKLQTSGSFLIFFHANIGKCFFSMYYVISNNQEACIEYFLSILCICYENNQPKCNKDKILKSISHKKQFVFKIQNPKYQKQQYNIYFAPKQNKVHQFSSGLMHFQ